jgi:3-dehydroquinate synthetase
MAEVIKHGVIGAPDLLDELEAGAAVAHGLQGAQLARALQVKIRLVEEDPFEGGQRAVLNLGHTAGHALEKLSGFELRHGEAVAIGMVAAARIAAALGRGEPALVSRLEALLAAWGLPVRCPPFPVAEIRAAMAHDKKRRGRGVRWVLPRRPGEVEIVDDVPAEVVNAVLQGMGATGA